MKSLERRISIGDRTLTVQGMMVKLSSIIPNPNQPRMANLLDSSLRTSLLETRGLTTPLLVEKLAPDAAASYIKKLEQRYYGSTEILDFLKTTEPQYVIIDGERRWCNSVNLIQENPEVREFLSEVPTDIISEDLSEKERYVVWVSIHKIRKDWKAMEKETAAFRLAQLMDPMSAANVLGVSLPQLQRFIETYNLAQRMKKGANERSISYAREIMSLAKRMRPQETVDAIVEKVNRHVITDAVDIRSLRGVLDDPNGRKEFLKSDETIAAVVAKSQAPAQIQVQPGVGLKQDLATFRMLIEKYGWRDTAALKGDLETMREVDNTMQLLADIKKALS